jgi:hypothetical protein
MTKLTAPQIRRLIEVRDDAWPKASTGSSYVGMNNRLYALGLITYVPTSATNHTGCALTDAGRAALEAATS